MSFLTKIKNLFKSEPQEQKQKQEGHVIILTVNDIKLDENNQYSIDARMDGDLELIEKLKQFGLQGVTDEDVMLKFVAALIAIKFQNDNSAPWIQETHSLTSDGQIRYERNWNNSFIHSAQAMGINGQTEAEVADIYMNYVYGVRMMEELESKQESTPVSDAHPELAEGHRLSKG